MFCSFNAEAYTYFYKYIDNTFSIKRQSLPMIPLQITVYFYIPQDRIYLITP